jgi:hypothetical protein
LLVFLSIIGGVSLFGISGIVYGPFIVTLFLTAAALYEEKYRDLIAVRFSSEPGTRGSGERDNYRITPSFESVEAGGNDETRQQPE